MIVCCEQGNSTTRVKTHVNQELGRASFLTAIFFPSGLKIFLSTTCNHARSFLSTYTFMTFCTLSRFYLKSVLVQVYYNTVEPVSRDHL